MRKHVVHRLAVLAAGGLLFAAEPQQGPPPGMMQGRMGPMRGAIAQNPLARSTMLAFVLPDMQSELGLSSTQAAELGRLRTQFISQEQTTSAEIAAARKKLSDSVASGTAPEVQGAINSLTTLQGRRMLNAYQTASNMKAVLTPQQRTSLQAMTPAQLRSAMMSHMTMNQMSQMMQIMRGTAGAGMMGGGMMGQGMMGGGCTFGAPQQSGD
jgi:hypothetical protein